ncbi:acyltransferase family protein [Rhodococcus sp. NPDC003318]|uniref:acyltransferase family protein n=1 Tax=Rhodococcus sp. NPDC003318 TaxID=3364503 RepID=UPI0036CDE574
MLDADHSLPRGRPLVTSLLSRPKSRRRKPDPKAHQRLDIQGLRMVAVMLVVLSHLFHWPSGGFIGVDVFFVISGFLITGSLVHTMEKTGRISFSSFYRRRVRRIVPAATLVLVATIAASYFVFTDTRFKSTVWDAVAAFFFVSNWRFGIEGTDYFNAGGPVSPLQHYWSLSVEEQFYFVWPAVILVVGMIAAHRSRRMVAAAVMGVVVVVSFAYSMFDTASNPTWAYFSTLTRVWELGVGALLAITIAWYERIPDAIRPFLAWAGLLLIAVGAFAISEGGGGFPAPWAAVPVLGAGLVIAAGVGGDHRFLSILTNRVSVYIGDISYSLYLWHWPIIILLGSLIEPSGIYYYVGALLLMFGLSILAYHFYEDRIRQSNWLMTTAESRDRRVLDLSRWRLKNLRMKESHQTIAILSLIAITAGLVSTTLAATASPSAAPISQSRAATQATGAEAAAQSPRAAAISAAIRATEFPDFDPPIDKLGDLRVPQWTENGCLNVRASNESKCVYGPADAPLTAVLLGDSIAVSYLPGLIGALGPEGYRVHSYTMEGCATAVVDATSSVKSKADYAECDEHRSWSMDRVRALNPDLIVISDSHLTVTRLQSGAKGSAAEAEWVEGLSRVMSGVPDPTKVVFLTSPPGAGNLAECAGKFGDPSDCTRAISTEWFTVQAAEETVASKFGARLTDSRPWFCTDSGYCPSFVGTTPVYVDSGHMTATYSEGLAPDLRSALLSAN